MPSAQLNGTLLDDGGASTQVRFEYGVGAFTDYTAWKDASSGDTFYEIITGLLGNTTYQYRAAATNLIGTSYGSTVYLAIPASPAVVTIQAATNVLPQSATLNGTLLYDGGEACHVRFHYGLSVAYGEVTDWQYPTVTADTFTAALTSLGSGLVFHAMAEALNAHGSVFSSDIVFRTMNSDEYPSIGLDPVLQLIM